MQIINNKALLLNARDPGRITRVIPKSKLVAPHKVLVHWGLDECRVLNNLGVKNVPSPILRNYGWPGLFKPFEHQKTTAAFMTMHRRAFCFNSAGIGKTSSMIWAADYLMNLGIIKRVLVVCPLSIMTTAWVNDLFKTAMHRKVIVAYNKNPDTRRAIIRNTDAEFVIINYDGVEVALDAILEKNFDLVIADECSYLKTATTRRWKTFSKLLKPDTWLWMMTGTPAAQSPLDAYGLAKLVNPSNVPRFFGAFRDQVMYKVTNFKWVPKPDAQQMVFKALQPAIRFTKEECLDLPEMTYVYREAPLTPQQEKYYKILKREFTIDAAGESITGVNAAANLNKMIQICSGSVFSDSGEVVEFDWGNRFSALKEVIDEAAHKVLVFAMYTHTIGRLKEALSKAKYKVAVVDGSVSVGNRTQIFHEFQNTDKINVLLIQPQAASHGVTLHAADTVVYWTPVMSVETYLQCNARVDRVGQKNKTTVVHLQGTDLERKMYRVLKERIDFHQGVVDLYREVLSGE